MQHAATAIQYFENTQTVKYGYLLWEAIYRQYDLIELIAICESSGLDGSEHEVWKKSIYNLLQEALMDEKIIGDMDTFVECEKLIDELMTMLNLGLTMGPKLVHFMRLVLAYSFRLIHKRGWDPLMKMESSEDLADTGNEDSKLEEINKAMYTVNVISIGVVMLDMAAWIGRGPTPVVFHNKGIISPEDIDSERIDLEIVRELVEYLEDQELIAFQLFPPMPEMPELD